MGFVVLFAVGAVLAWLASIIMHRDDARSVGQHLAVGAVGAIAAGALASRGSLLVGVSPVALLAGVAGAIFLLGLLATARMRIAR